jgi:hypothetical protein
MPERIKRVLILDWCDRLHVNRSASDKSVAQGRASRFAPPGALWSFE